MFMLAFVTLLAADLTVENGLRLHYLDSGQGEAIVLIAGMGVRLSVWDSVADGLDDHMRVIRLDNRGMGDSGDLEGAYTVDTMAEDAAMLMAALDIEKYHVAGLSLGSFAAQALALNHPDRVKTLTLIGSSAGGPIHVAPDAEVMTYFQSLFAMTKEQRTDMGLKLSLHPSWAQANADQVAVMRAESIDYTPPPAVITRQIMAALAFDHSERAKRIAVPTLVIHGDSDRIVPTANGRNLAKLIPDSTYVEVENSGHVTNVDAADVVVKSIKAHVEK